MQKRFPQALGTEGLIFLLFVCLFVFFFVRMQTALRFFFHTGRLFT